MENVTSNSNTEHKRPEQGSAQADATRPATTPAQTAAQKPPEKAPEHAARVSGRDDAQEGVTGAETVTEGKRIDPLAVAEAKLKQKEARLAEKRNSLNQLKRKARDGQLFVWGAMVEAAYAKGSDADRVTIRAWAKKYLTEARHAERSDFGIFRLDKEREKAQGE